MQSVKDMRDIMGMPIAVELVGVNEEHAVLELVFEHFVHVDEVFSTYKPESEVSRMNRGALLLADASAHVQHIYDAAERTRMATGGYFDHHRPDGTTDPSGIVKGWSIQEAATLLQKRDLWHFCIDAGGDIQTGGVNAQGMPWSVGIRHPFETDKIVKVVYPHGEGVATSGTYVRGQHIYDPTTGEPVATPFVSLTVIGPNIYDADRFATAAFAMGDRAMQFVETLPGYEAYAITRDGRAILTSNFNSYTQP